MSKLSGGLRAALFATFLVLLDGANDPALASEANGTIGTLRFSTSANGGPRISIFVAGVFQSQCGHTNWYAFEPTGTPLHELWTKALMTAYEQNRKLRIKGTGNCDATGVETIEYIDLI